jgi:hypothetical protein
MKFPLQIARKRRHLRAGCAALGDATTKVWRPRALDRSVSRRCSSTR